MASTTDAARVDAVAAYARREGVVVREIDGWRTRGATWTRGPVGLIEHHDASTVKAGEWGSLGVIVTGRVDVPGPLSQFQGARCLDGVPKVAVVAAGRANHAGPGGPRRFGPHTVPANNGNSWLYGCEWANDGVTEQYTAAAMHARVVLARAVLEVLT